MMTNWFYVKIQYNNGSLITHNSKAFTEILIDAMSYTEVEARTIKFCEEEALLYGFPKQIKPLKISDIFQYDDHEIWYAVLVEYVTYNETNGKAKVQLNTMYVTAESTIQACERIMESLAKMIVPFEIIGVKRTKIDNILPYVAPEKPAASGFEKLADELREKGVEVNVTYTPAEVVE